MATITQARERVQTLRDQIERMKVLGADIFPDAVSLGFIVSKTSTLAAEVVAACVPNTGAFLGLFNVACPSGWEAVTALNDTFLMGGATYGTTGGASTHTHTYDAISSHTHGTGFSFGGDASYHTHSYTTRGATGDKMVVVFNVSCPAGWTRVSAWDDKFLRGASSYGGTGGSSGTHTHSYSGVIAHSHGAGTLATASAGTHTHSYNQLSGAGAGEVGGGTNSVLINTQNNDTGSGGSHTHSIGGNTTSTGDASATSGTATMLPPYVEVVFCSRN